jgi:hypothetical protein
MFWLESVFDDVRYGLRAMRRTPLITAVAVLSLALGIGANTAIFTVLDALLLRLLPVKNPREIVLLDGDFSFPVFERFRRSSVQVFGFSFVDGLTTIVRGNADYTRGEAVSGNYYTALGVKPIMGRALADDDDRESAVPVCVVNHRFSETASRRECTIDARARPCGT